ncbi:hypothetical protein NQ314_007574 [Rhamnusium bicolor]|uniref:MADF domain-containing protein n=1 Tax=Rhamnusium bicolor TaxID=1586634 RepID=A0AAV8YNK5_9CUCU|nr:hypothetical protein NQ314_007574 [Rhamnusium bicolor]
MDVEKLIALVEKKSPIWDKSDRRHSNLKYLDKLWDAIAAELEVSKKAVKDKWKNLRDQYRSQLSKISVPRSGDSASDSSYEPSWSYYKPLHFLKDQMKPRTSSGNLNHSQLSQQTGNDTISDEEFDNVKIEVNDDDNSNISVPKSSSLELDRNFFSSAYQNHENNEHRGKKN